MFVPFSEDVGDQANVASHSLRGSLPHLFCVCSDSNAFETPNRCAQFRCCSHFVQKVFFFNACIWVFVSGRLRAASYARNPYGLADFVPHVVARGVQGTLFTTTFSHLSQGA